MTTPAKSAASAAPPARLEVRNISKSYPGCRANDSISLAVGAGEIHALLGENGAGKSTLVKMIYGVLKPDSGTILFDGVPIEVANPAAARRQGVGMVFQHFSLFDALSVANNIALGIEPMSKRALRRKIANVVDRYGLQLELDRVVHELSAGEKQRIEIVRCLLGEPRLLILDEPTSVLTPQESDSLFDTLRRLADEDCSVLYISHKLDEVRRLCKRATILRHGSKVAEVDPREHDPGSLAALMVGAELRSLDRGERIVADSTELLGVRQLASSVDQGPAVVLHDIEFSVHRGEIVGIAGVAGNGQAQLLDRLTGEQRSRSNCIVLNGQSVGDKGPLARRRMGLGVVPEDRLGHATAASMTLLENAFLTAYERRKLTVGGFTLPGRIRAFTKAVMNRFDVRGAGPTALASELSGGNLQKFIVGREIEQTPQLLIIAQPTWGVDAGAAVAIHQALHDLAKSGAGILLISQDLDELLALSHRIGALCGGRLSAFWPTHAIDRQQMGLAMAGQALADRPN